MESKSKLKTHSLWGTPSSRPGRRLQESKDPIYLKAGQQQDIWGSSDHTLSHAEPLDSNNSTVNLNLPNTQVRLMTCSNAKKQTPRKSQSRRGSRGKPESRHLANPELTKREERLINYRLEADSHNIHLNTRKHPAPTIIVSNAGQFEVNQSSDQNSPNSVQKSSSFNDLDEGIYDENTNILQSNHQRSKNQFAIPSPRIASVCLGDESVDVSSSLSSPSSLVPKVTITEPLPIDPSTLPFTQRQEYYQMRSHTRLEHSRQRADLQKAQELRFKPNIYNPRPRSLNEFLKDQEKHQMIQKQRVKQVKEKLEIKQRTKMAKKTPLILSRAMNPGKEATAKNPVVSMPKQSKMQNSDIYGQKEIDIKFPKNGSLIVVSKPEIGKQISRPLSQNTARSRNRLGISKTQNNSSKTRTPSRINAKSQKMILQRFSKEFDAVLKGVLGEKIPLLIEKKAYVEIMGKMGFLRKYVEQNGQILESKESTLVSEIWVFLNSCQIQAHKNGSKASVGDLKIFLMAILGIKGNKRLGATNLNPIQDELLPTTLLFGWLNSSDQLCLSLSDVDKIQSKFMVLSSNRQIFLGEQIQYRREIQAEKSQPSFKPDLAKTIRKETQSPIREMINNSQMIIARQQKKIIESELNLKINELELQKACTFKPDISNSQRCVSNTRDRFRKFEHLYSTNKKRKDLSFNSLDLREFESQKKECTFKPKILEKYNSIMPILESRNNVTMRTLSSMKTDSERKKTKYQPKEYFSNYYIS